MRIEDAEWGKVEYRAILESSGDGRSAPLMQNAKCKMQSAKRGTGATLREKVAVPIMRGGDRERSES